MQSSAILNIVKYNNRNRVALLTKLMTRYQYRVTRKDCIKNKPDIQPFMQIMVVRSYLS